MRVEGWRWSLCLETRLKIKVEGKGKMEIKMKFHAYWVPGALQMGREGTRRGRDNDVNRIYHSFFNDLCNQ
jgi:hypothetical protein